MTLVHVLLPVLGRPERVRELVASLIGSQRDVALAPVFLCSDGDLAEMVECHRVCQPVEDALVFVMPWSAGRGDYARKTNWGAAYAREAGADYVFLGADDLCFCEGWADQAVTVAKQTGAMVVGTNDLGNPLVTRGRHATHSLVDVRYLDQGTIDEPGKLLHEGYDHQYVDTELVATAKHRGVWAFAHGSHVEHLHYLWGKGRDDATYRKGQRDGAADMRLFTERQRLWQ